VPRSYGTGSLRHRPNKKGGETWYAQIRVGTRFVKRVIGPKRLPGGSDGLTKTQAEARLRKLIDELREAPPIAERMTLPKAAELRIDHVANVLERKRTTVQDYRIMLAKHIEPFFSTRPLDDISGDRILAYIKKKTDDGLSIKTITNHLNFISSVFNWSIKRGWARANPVTAIDRPRIAGTDPDIRYLTLPEFEKLLAAVPDDVLGAIERPLYLAAALTGLRQGELAALRWRDVDFAAGLVRCRRTYTRGDYGAPKSRRSSRAVPMVDRLAAQLKDLGKASHYRGDDDLVFAHPFTGGPYDASKLRKRYKEALARAGVREVRFHDLRHTFGTHMAAAGAPLRAIQEWMGHSDYKTTSIYADFSLDAVQGREFAERAFGAD
jgi:integrase